MPLTIFKQCESIVKNVCCITQRTIILRKPNSIFMFEMAKLVRCYSEVNSTLNWIIYGTHFAKMWSKKKVNLKEEQNPIVANFREI